MSVIHTDTLEVTGEMGVNISIITLRDSAHFLKVKKKKKKKKEADVMKQD